MPVGDAFNWGWTKFQQNVGPILIAALILFVGLMIVEAIIWFGLVGSLAATTTTHTTTYGTTYTTSSGGGFVLFIVGYGAAMLIYFVGASLSSLPSSGPRWS